jgi:hypothetical protein
MAGIPASGGPEPAPRRFGLASPVTATVLAVLALILMAAALVLSALVRQLSVLGSGPIVPIVVVYAAVGFVVARRQPGNPIGWILSGFIVVIAASFGISSTSVAGEILGIALAALPVGIGVGILKYRLYDIDRIISRTLAYAIVTGVLVGVYAGLVLVATQVLGFHSSVAVAVSTLAAAALFNPLRRRVQRAVNRRFNRARYDADQTVAAFAARLKDAVDLDAVRDDLASVVRQALEPAHVSLWIRQRD